MGLSEREQQLLDEMERRLYQSEADVMQTPSGSRKRLNLRSVVLGIVLGIVGLGVLIGGVAAQQLWLGLIGFAIMLGGALLAFTRKGGDAVETGAASSQGDRGRGAHPQESFGDRMSRRWDERMEGER